MHIRSCPVRRACRRRTGSRCWHCAAGRTFGTMRRGRRSAGCWRQSTVLTACCLRRQARRLWASFKGRWVDEKLLRLCEVLVGVPESRSRGPQCCRRRSGNFHSETACERLKSSIALQGAVCAACLITVMLWAAFSMRQWCQGRPLLGQQTGESS